MKRICDFHILKNHEFFESIDFDKILKREFKSEIYRDN